MKKKQRGTKGAGTVRRRADGRWEARFTVGINSKTGKEIRKSVYGKTQNEVRKKMTEAIAAVDNGTYKEPCKMTLEEWLEVWLEKFIRNLKPATIASYRAQVYNNIIPIIGAVPLSSLTANTIQDMYNLLLDGGAELPRKMRSTGNRRVRKPLSPKSLRNIHGVLHEALEKAVELDYIRKNPTNACELPNKKKPEIKPLELDAASEFLAASQNDEYRNIYFTALFTGMRQGEVLGLTWPDINFKTGEITIRQQLQKQKTSGGKFYFASLKNGKTRHFTAAPTVLEVLKKERQRQDAAKLAAGTDWDKTGGVYLDSKCTIFVEESNLVFTTDTGRHLVAGTVYKHFKQIASSIGRPDARFHDLRHSFAVMSLQSGVDFKTLQNNLGHASSGFTLDEYGHVSRVMDQHNATCVENCIQTVQNVKGSTVGSG